MIPSQIIKVYGKEPNRQSQATYHPSSTLGSPSGSVLHILLGSRATLRSKAFYERSIQTASQVLTCPREHVPATTLVLWKMVFPEPELSACHSSSSHPTSILIFQARVASLPDLPTSASIYRWPRGPARLWNDFETCRMLSNLTRH